MPLSRAVLRKTLEQMDAPELGVLVEEFFAASSDNKRLLTAKLEGDSSKLLDKYHSELAKAFRTSGRLPTLKVAGAKKALGAYVKVAALHEALSAELDYVESGLRCLKKFGDWPENNYSSVAGVFQDALKRAADLPHDQIPFRQLERLVGAAERFGLRSSPNTKLRHVAQTRSLTSPNLCRCSGWSCT